MPTIELVKNLLINFQEYKTKVELLEKPNQIELNPTLKQKFWILQQQMNLLNISMKCLTEKEKKMLEMIYKEKVSLRDLEKVFYTCKSNLAKKRDKALKKLAEIYDSLT